MSEVIELNSQLNPRIFRFGHTQQRKVMNFAVTQGGLGDYVCLLTVLEWIAKNHPQVDGRVYCIEWFHPIAKNVLKPFFPRWKVYPRERLTDKKLHSRPSFLPTEFPISRLGASSIDLGFIYYLNMVKPEDEEIYYSKLDLSEIDHIGPQQPYVVMTPGASNKPKTLKPETFNAIKNHVISKGLVPVFLGSDSTIGGRKITFEEGYDYSNGLDLRGKTSLLTAAGLMAKARLVVGLDNGLLHLAAMTEVPIIFGYTISSPQHTRPLRQSGNIFDIYPDPEKLSCLFCSSRMRFVNDINFSQCIYGDSQCAEDISNPEAWCRLIDKVLDAQKTKG